jgi:hypothetical protein
MTQSFILAFLFLFTTLMSCKNSSSSDPSSEKNINLLNISLDGRAKSYNYSGSSLTPQIVLSFSEPIDKTTAKNYFLFAGGTVSISLSFTHHDSVVTVQPTSKLQYFTSYNLQILPQLESTTQKILGGISSGIIISIVTQVDQAQKFPTISDSTLLNMVEQQTLKYFYDFAEPTSGMARERNTSGTTVTTGGSGFGLMAMIAGIRRGFITRANGVARFNKVITFLEKADKFHGAWPHWIDGTTGKVIPFSPNDNGADLVETAYMAQGLISLRQYLTSADTVGNNLINRINTIWKNIEWDWFRQGDQNVLYWHWSPDKGWTMNMPVQGYNEALIVYILAAASPTHSIPLEVYQQGWARNGSIKNGKSFYNHILPLGEDYGGPLFFAHYSFLGFDPHVQDAYDNYWTQNVNHALINHDYCEANPMNFANYLDNCWGLTASDIPSGYGAQSPTNDNGTITPTAAISSMPYTPTQSMNAIKYFYYTLGDKLWGQYGFYDAINFESGWTATSMLAIDQGPIVVMIENYRSQLLWKLFMSAPEVQAAKTKLGFY